MNPAGEEQTLEFQDWFVPEGRVTEQLKAAMVYQKDVLQPEDIGLCESVQRGLKSRGYNQGRFMSTKSSANCPNTRCTISRVLVMRALKVEPSE
eukprot:UN04345